MWKRISLGSMLTPQISTSLTSAVSSSITAVISHHRDTWARDEKRSISNIGSGGSLYKCKDNPDATADYTTIIGVVGAAESSISLQVANLLKLFYIPQISYFSTSPDLSNKERYPYFLRTIPSDASQAEVMIEIIKKLSWKYISIIYDATNYGLKGFVRIGELINKEDSLCTAVTYQLSQTDPATHDAAIKALAKQKNAKGVIVFAKYPDVIKLMRAVEENNVTSHFMWIGSDGWQEAQLANIGGFREELEGAITVHPLAHTVTGFSYYFRNLKPDHQNTNPWFNEFWEQHFKCKLPSTQLSYFNKDYKNCTGQEKISKDFIFEPRLQFVSDAVMAFAHALKNMHTEVCGGRRGICAEMNPISGETLLYYLKNVQFTSLAGAEEFHFESNGDGANRYILKAYRQRSPGNFSWENVGEYDKGILTMEPDKLIFKMNSTDIPKSECSKPCSEFEATRYIALDKCCWTCQPCTEHQYLPTPHKCQDCPNGTEPNAFRNACTPLPEVHLSFKNGVAIGAVTCSVWGILFTLFVIYVFVRHRDTPIVKASSRELSFVLLAGILLCYLMTFIIIAKPSGVICGLQKFGIGLCFSLCYSALLTKTNRIARIFAAGKRTTKRPMFISPRSQLIICGAIVFIQIMIDALWLAVRPPEARYIYPTKSVNMLVCLAHVGDEYIIAFIYPIILLIICTVYAILTRKIPEAFNESRYIGLTVYTTCIIWLAFVPIFFTTATDIPLRMCIMAFVLDLSATVSLMCLFFPRLYIILLKPERNVKQAIKKKINTLEVKEMGFHKEKNSWSRDSGNHSEGKGLIGGSSVDRFLQEANCVESEAQCREGVAQLTQSTGLLILGISDTCQTLAGPDLDVRVRLTKRKDSLNSDIENPTVGTQTPANFGADITTQTEGVCVVMANNEYAKKSYVDAAVATDVNTIAMEENSDEYDSDNSDFASIQSDIQDISL
ncbi:metabotropic glutamate receptor 6 [Lingula anatina]|uniref:Metabotropic glutamate receptor 6 n=1 Tax=Lingula anatina TaxID=7574 RepID=A0A1S3I208_LINAN|nr:metabotropic glutamate receptor 6 [Lingula anatina]|eukprot:XP_013392302.1 metabotropic glutamate receptor 6 [Lingula anatina]